MTHKPFKYDGCTMFPDGDWGDPCCLNHDLDYWNNAPLPPGRGMSRRTADRKMRRCISARGYPVVAWTAYFGARAFGWYFWRRHRAIHRHLARIEAKEIVRASRQKPK